MARLSLANIHAASSSERGLEKITDVSLEIADREFITLVGPRGSGASSLIRILAGLDQPHSGEILLDQQGLNELSPKERDVALVPANFKPYLRGSVHDNLFFPLKLRNRPKPEIMKRIDGAAELVGIKNILEREATSLSAEECQRVAIARAIVVQPKVLLFDDAFSNLESETQFQLRDELRKLYQRLQLTTIFGTHDPKDAIAMGGRLVVMSDGAIEQSGEAGILYERPASTFVGQFLAGMNLISGTLKQDRDAWVFTEQGEGTIKLRWPVSKGPGAGFTGGATVLGVLPENIEIVDSKSEHEKSNDSFPAIVDLAEPMGSQLTLRLQTGAHAVVAISRLTNDLPASGRRARFKLNPEKLCFFDPGSQRRID